MKPLSALRRPVVLLFLMGLCSFGAGCTAEEEQVQVAALPPLETRADSLALQAFEAFGGPEAWAALPYLRFDFGAGNDSTRRVSARHLWNRRTGDYRVEMPAGEDTTYVALFNVGTQEGTVYLDGAPVDSTRQAELLQRAYRRFINDTYWLLAPTKLFDPGVTRSYVPDSSGPGAEVVHLAFEGVGLTPGDQYWIHVDPATGRVNRWDYHLQGMAPEEPARSFAWVDYQTFETPAGPVHLATRKTNGGFSLFTDHIEVPAEVPDEMFTDPQPRL